MVVATWRLVRGRVWSRYANLESYFQPNVFLNANMHLRAKYFILELGDVFYVFQYCLISVFKSYNFDTKIIQKASNDLTVVLLYFFYIHISDFFQITFFPSDPRIQIQ